MVQSYFTFAITAATMSTAFAARQEHSRASIKRSADSLDVSLAAGTSFQVMCPELAEGDVLACSGPDVAIIDGACRPKNSTELTGDLGLVTVARELGIMRADFDRQKNDQDDHFDELVANLTDFIADKTVELEGSLSAAIEKLCPPATYIDADGSCKDVTPCKDGEFYVRLATKDKDAECKAHRTCDAKTEYERTAPTLFSDRVCVKFTECTKTEVETVPPTKVSDRICVEVPGKTKETAKRSCKVIMDTYPGVPKNGFFFVDLADAGTVQTECNFDHEGGGWTLIGRGIGGKVSCWRNTASQGCNMAKMTTTTETAHWNDKMTNKINYKWIWHQGLGTTPINYYWKGKQTGHCTYGWYKTASGECTCSHETVNWGNRRCGRPHSNHRATTDWPNRSCLHAVGIWHHGWYNRANNKDSHGNCGPNNSKHGYCTGNNRNCDIKVWVRE